MAIEQRQPQGLVDILDKILDKGLVVAGDIKVSLANVELLTIQLRLVICSTDKAQATGSNWWHSDRLPSRPRPQRGWGRHNRRNVRRLHSKRCRHAARLGFTPLDHFSH